MSFDNTIDSGTKIPAYPPINRRMFLDRLRPQFDDVAFERVGAAYKFAKYGHRGIFRDDGVTRYVDHVRAVAWIAIDELEIYDCELIVEALLHDIREDTYLLSSVRIRINFGRRIARGIELLSKIPAEGYYDRLMLYGTWRELIIKLADRLHNLRTLGSCPVEKQRRQIAETRMHILPLVVRLRELRPRQQVWADYLESQIVQICEQYEAGWPPVS